MSRLFKYGLLQLFILGFFTLTAAGGTRDPNTPDEKYLEFGQKFPSVAQLKALIVKDDIDPAEVEAISFAPDVKEKRTKLSFQIGSAVIIKPNWVLTAGHVVNGAAIAVLTPDNGEDYPLTKLIVHKDFETGKFGLHDIALCYSPKAFNLKFYTPLYTDADEAGKAVTISGYGVHGTFSTGATDSDGKKRAGHNRIDSSSPSTLICTPSASRDKFPLEFLIAPGDSGGGLFIGNKLAGINSFLMCDKGHKPNGAYSNEAAFTRVSAYIGWIEEQITLHELSLDGRLTQAADLDAIPPRTE
jgi:hypothetical protein